jgi:hypothetical protein
MLKFADPPIKTNVDNNNNNENNSENNNINNGDNVDNRNTDKDDTYTKLDYIKLSNDLHAFTRHNFTLYNIGKLIVEKRYPEAEALLQEERSKFNSDRVDTLFDIIYTCKYHESTIGENQNAYHIYQEYKKGFTDLVKMLLDIDFVRKEAAKNYKDWKLDELMDYRKK